MNSRPSQLVFVKRSALQRVEREMAQVVHAHHLAALCLIDRTGLLLASVGDLPLPPDQMGATAAGVFSAIGAIVRVPQRCEFSVQLASQSVLFHFCEVDSRLFLCAFSMDSSMPSGLSDDLHTLSKRAANLFADRTSDSRSIGNLEFISEKLDQLFSKTP